MKSPWLLGFIAFLIAASGAYFVSLGHDGVVIGAVFTLLGAIVGVGGDRLWTSRRDQP